MRNKDKTLKTVVFLLIIVGFSSCMTEQTSSRVQKLDCVKPPGYEYLFNIDSLVVAQVDNNGVDSTTLYFDGRLVAKMAPNSGVFAGHKFLMEDMAGNWSEASLVLVDSVILYACSDINARIVIEGINFSNGNSIFLNGKNIPLVSTRKFCISNDFNIVVTGARRIDTFALRRYYLKNDNFILDTIIEVDYQTVNDSLLFNFASNRLN